MPEFYISPSVILCPKGTKAAYIAEISYNPNEQEMLIQRNTILRVIRAERVQIQLIPEETKMKLWIEVIKQQ